jgi:xylan 1,4-beta-xylosidase
MMRAVNINVSADKVIGELTHNWRYIGYDECNYTHTPEGEELLAKFGQLEDAPYYFRAHHLLCNGNLHGTYKWGSTNIYTEDDDGNVTYDYTIIDKINDTFLKHGGIPFFELGFMPMQLAGDVKWDWGTFGEYKNKNWAKPPKDYNKWRDLIYNLVRHCVERYGKDEVVKWYWELWNEPDIFYWAGTLEEFCKLYDYTEEAVHAALPEARLGAPSTTGPFPDSSSAKFLDAFLSHCKNGTNYVTGKTGTRLDYITFHVKGGGFPFRLNAPKATPSTKSFSLQVETGCEIIKKYGYDNLEIVLSEADPDGWAAGGRFDNANMNFRNTEYYASYIACSYNQTERIAKSFNMDVRPLAWAFMFVAERCFEGTRTFSTQGIDKASLNLFKMYAKMGGTEIAFESSGTVDALTNDMAVPEISGMAAKDENGRVQVLVYSHHDDWDITEQSEVSLTVGGLTDGQEYNVTHYRIDDKYSNAYQAWLAESSPDYPSAEQYARIKAKDSLEQFEPIKTIKASGDNFSLKFMMPARGISLFIIE